MIVERHQRMIEDAASKLIAVADDSGTCLVEVIGRMERFIVNGTKVGDAKLVPVDADRYGYTLQDGRLVRFGPPPV
jgi:hypothetical protein